MKFIRVLIIVSGFILSSSCEKYLDVNDNPNKTENASVEVVLPAAQASTAIHIGGELYNLGGFWAQYHTQSPDAGQYEQFDQYNISADFFDRTWQELYAGALRDLKYIKEESKGVDNSYYLIAVALEAYTYQVLVDLYGQVPYSEALQGDNGILNPKYDDGAEIYQSLLANIDEALGLYNNDPGSTPGSNDLLLSGDMNQWIGFANTLKLKMYLRAHDDLGEIGASPADVLALANGGSLLSQNVAMTLFEAAPNKSNPFYDVNYDRLGGVNHAGSQSMITYFQDNDDARLGKVYETGAGGLYTTKPQGDFANRDISFSNLAKPVVGPLKPIYFFTVAEVNFLVAEAQERFGGGGQPAYEAGILASFEMYGLSDTASTYYGAGGVYEYNSAGSQEDRVKQIMTQKWAAMANSQNLEAYFEITRSGYPEYKPLSSWMSGDLQISLASVLPAGQTPKRLLFADVSKTRNGNTPTQPSGGIIVPIWWAQ